MVRKSFIKPTQQKAGNFVVLNCSRRDVYIPIYLTCAYLQLTHLLAGEYFGEDGGVAAIPGGRVQVAAKLIFLSKKDFCC